MAEVSNVPDRDRIASLICGHVFAGRDWASGRLHGTLDAADAIIAAFRHALVPDWRPMDTAPTDGSRILVWCGDRQGVQIASYEPDRYAKSPRPFFCYSNRRSEDRAAPPLRWMPLPEKPELLAGLLSLIDGGERG